MNILLDSSGDWAVSGGKLQLATGQEEIAQIVATRLRTFLGEYFLDVRIGVPWFSKIFKKNPNQAEVEALLIQTIADSPGIITIQDFQLSLDNKTRKLRVDFRAQSVEGLINFSEVVP
jgi:hypothetical protein